MSTATLLTAVEAQIEELLTSPVEEYRSAGSAANQNVRRRSLPELMNMRDRLRAELAAQNQGVFSVADVRE